MPMPPCRELRYRTPWQDRNRNSVPGCRTVPASWRRRLPYPARHSFRTWFRHRYRYRDRHCRKRRRSCFRIHRHRSLPAQDSRLRQAARLRPGTSRTGSARRKEAYTSLKVKGHGSLRFRRSLYIRPCPQTTTGSCRKKYNLIRKNSRPSRTAAPDTCP